MNLNLVSSPPPLGKVACLLSIWCRSGRSLVCWQARPTEDFSPLLKHLQICAAFCSTLGKKSYLLASLGMVVVDSAELTFVKNNFFRLWMKVMIAVYRIYI